MVPLDQNLIKNIKRLVLDYVEGPAKVKEETWHDCIAAINAKIAQLRKKRRNIKHIGKLFLKYKIQRLEFK
jgi:hypothetical protein